VGVWWEYSGSIVRVATEVPRPIFERIQEITDKKPEAHLNSLLKEDPVLLTIAELPKAPDAEVKELMDYQVASLKLMFSCKLDITILTFLFFFIMQEHY
jgi:hypothetical protein